MAMAKKVEERWTPTAVHAVFLLPPLSRKPKDGAISVDLPFPNLGWSFALSLSPLGSSKKHSPETYQWNPVALAFHRRGKVIPWGNTSMDAELSLTTDPPTTSNGLPAPPSLDNSPKLLVTMKNIALGHSNSLEIKPAPCALSLLSPSKISLTLTMSECPFSEGLFHHVTSGGIEEVDALKWLVKQSGGRLLSQSLSTGTVHDVRFMACASRSTSESNDKTLLETYVWLSVLKGHVNPSLARLSERSTSILSCHENSDTEPVVEIPCPDDYEYELDSDYDEDEAIEPAASLFPGEHDSVTLQDEESDSKAEGIKFPSLFSSFEQDRVSDASSLDSLPEEIIKDPEAPPDPSSKASTADCERTVVIKFAAHRTWRAFLWYCYTGDIEFCELQSQVEHGVRRLRAVGSDGPPSCSPKSMYRLADFVGDKALKDLSLEAIRTRMTKINVLEETFSVFTSKYPEVLETQLNVLIQRCGLPEVKKAFLREMSKSGILPHAEPALAAFYDRLVATATSRAMRENPSTPTAFIGW